MKHISFLENWFQVKTEVFLDKGDHILVCELDAVAKEVGLAQEEVMGFDFRVVHLHFL